MKNRTKFTRPILLVAALGCVCAFTLNPQPSMANQYGPGCQSDPNPTIRANWYEFCIRTDPDTDNSSTASRVYVTFNGANGTTPDDKKGLLMDYKYEFNNLEAGDWNCFNYSTIDGVTKDVGFINSIKMKMHDKDNDDWCFVQQYVNYCSEEGQKGVQSEFIAEGCMGNEGGRRKEVSLPAANPRTRDGVVMTATNIRNVGNWARFCTEGAECTLTHAQQYTVSQGIVESWSNQLKTSFSTSVTDSLTGSYKAGGGTPSESSVSSTLSTTISVGLERAVTNSKSQTDTKTQSDTTTIACKETAPPYKAVYFWKESATIGGQFGESVSVVSPTCEFACSSTGEAPSWLPGQNIGSCEPKWCEKGRTFNGERCVLDN